MAALDRGGDVAADGGKLRPLEEQYLRLQQSPAFELDAPHREHERIHRRDILRQQGGRPDAGMDGVPQRGHIDQQAVEMIGGALHRPRQPGALPMPGQERQLRVVNPRGRMSEQRKDFHLAAILRVQLDMPGLAQLHRHGGGELARLRAMRR